LLRRGTDEEGGGQVREVRHKEIHREGSEALEQAAQRSCGSPSLAVFKARLDGPLSNLVW